MIVEPVTPDSGGGVAGVSTAALERIAARGWQAAAVEELGGWTLRAGHGFTGRANSVLPLGDPGVPLRPALAIADLFYRRHDLPTVFQIPGGADPAGDALDVHLQTQGWEAFNHTAVLVGRVPPEPAAAAPVRLRWDLRPEPDEAWLQGYLYRGAVLPDTAVRVLVNAENVVFASLRDDRGAARAVARAVVTGSWLGITAVTVASTHRRRGLGTAVMTALVHHGSAQGADHVYLQVDEANESAVRMYRQQGFRAHHGYHYLRRPVTRTLGG